MLDRCFIHTGSLGGHREAYLNFVLSILGGATPSNGVFVGHRNALLFLMVEDNFIRYVISALLRSALGRNTVGLLFRPLPAVSGRAHRHRFKRFVLKLLKRLPHVRTLSIVPVPLRPETGAIVDGWVHDFQLWDMGDAERAAFDALHAGSGSPTAAKLHARITQAAAGRPVLVALGAQNGNKGYTILAEALPALKDAGWFVVAAGKVADDQGDSRAAVEANCMMSVDRFLDDSEIIAAYAAADAVWCLYHPRYDQASGILGRAVQFGVPAVVRRGSLSEALCKSEAVPHVAAEGADDVAAALAALPAASPEAGRALSARLRKENIARLESALWGAGPEADE